MHGRALGVILIMIAVTRLCIADDSLIPIPKNQTLAGEPKFSADGNWLLYRTLTARGANGGNGTVVIWDLAAKRRLATAVTEWKHGWGPLDWSTDGARILTGSRHRYFVLWDFNSRPEKSMNVLTPLQEYMHSDQQPDADSGGNGTTVCFSPVSPEFASATDTEVFHETRENSLKIWRYRTPRRSNLVRQQSKRLADSPPLGENSDFEEPRLTIPLTSTPNKAAYSPDGKYLVVGFFSRITKGGGGDPNAPEVHVYDVETGGLVYCWKVKGLREMGGNTVDELQFSPNGTYIAISAGNMSIIVWDFASKLEVWRYDGLSNPCRTEVFTRFKVIVNLRGVKIGSAIVGGSRISITFTGPLAQKWS